ncbi:uncharacterized protein PAC_19649 [Phialocephala subalpina]|uniref:Heterokaryon incompatibility domain-containing protein n=1 Tax=Phialocephala subalpina TaxID=576137 RepID=A0A1L7XXM8_9HELO|nr:uncharacterized protein PAC_19649 [Phialocephala subalpina]
MSGSEDIYSTLNADEIRLLVLHPGANSSPIRCSFEYVSLSQKPQYEAVSYMWGIGQASHTILLTGKPYQVRDNLHDALFQLRNSKSQRVLWIDALCINQHDNRERNHQVAQMGLIYRQASGVCIWLGRANNVEARETVRFITRNSTSTPTSQLQFSPQWQKLSSMCGMSYWKRLWIIQEVALAAKLDIYWGDSVLSWDSFTNILRGPQTWEFPMKLNQQRQITKTAAVVEGADLFSLCLKYRDAECADQRDKIFGLLSLADKCCREAIEVNYSMSPHQLCGKVMAHYIKSHLVLSSSLDTFVSDLFLMRKVVGEGSMDEMDHEADQSQKYNTRLDHDGLGNSWDSAGWKRGSWSLLNRRPGSGTHDLNVRGYPRSRVKQVISCSKILATGVDLHELRLEKLSETNKSTHKMLECYAHYAMNFVAGVTEDDRGRLLVIPQTSPSDYERLSKMKTAMDNMLEKIHKSEIRIPSSASLLHLVWEIVQLIRNPLYKDCVLFLDDEGMAGLAPLSTQVNDIFVRFKNSESIDSYLSAIVREVDRSHMIIGRARHLTSARKYHEVPIEFGIDITSLQILTKPTPFDTHFHYISDLWQDRERHQSDFEALLSMTKPKFISSESESDTPRVDVPTLESESESPKRKSLGPVVRKKLARLIDKASTLKSSIRQRDNLEPPRILLDNPFLDEMNERSFLDHRAIPGDAQPDVGWPTRPVRARDTTWDAPGLISRNF